MAGLCRGCPGGSRADDRQRTRTVMRRRLRVGMLLVAWGAVVLAFVRTVLELRLDYRVGFVRLTFKDPARVLAAAAVAVGLCLLIYGRDMWRDRENWLARHGRTAAAVLAFATLAIALRWATYAATWADPVRLRQPGGLVAPRQPAHRARMGRAVRLAARRLGVLAAGLSARHRTSHHRSDLRAGRAPAHGAREGPHRRPRPVRRGADSRRPRRLVDLPAGHRASERRRGPRRLRSPRHQPRLPDARPVSDERRGGDDVLDAVGGSPLRHKARLSGVRGSRRCRGDPDSAEPRAPCGCAGAGDREPHPVDRFHGQAGGGRCRALRRRTAPGGHGDRRRSRVPLRRVVRIRVRERGESLRVVEGATEPVVVRWLAARDARHARAADSARDAGPRRPAPRAPPRRRGWRLTEGPGRWCDVGRLAVLPVLLLVRRAVLPPLSLAGVADDERGDRSGARLDSRDPLLLGGGRCSC